MGQAESPILCTELKKKKKKDLARNGQVQPLLSMLCAHSMSSGFNKTGNFVEHHSEILSS